MLTKGTAWPRHVRPKALSAFSYTALSAITEEHGHALNHHESQNFTSVARNTIDIAGSRIVKVVRSKSHIFDSGLHQLTEAGTRDPAPLRSPWRDLA